VDTPFDEGIHQHRLLLGGQKPLRLRAIHSQDALVKNPHVLDQRPLERKTRLGNDFLDFSELKNDRELPLIDREYRHGEQRQQAE
jgi:hypothetical protein